MKNRARRWDRLQREREQVSAQTADLNRTARFAGDRYYRSGGQFYASSGGRLSELQNQRGALDVELAQKNMSVPKTCATGFSRNIR